ncbi:uncharacterized protein CC84DRAFT_1200430 [Paraphaeosphaeria sporulosa]|uniref:Zn(2)-C6 fungal-type domain-containing protein n=1 Tax=Paraphaeosphaeria sporulosa TaxID=1460663 RepID=A0A177BX15_9PLEO|nr:uncharacterized protein CC84DRAFT_1200430 [Paraphaeosphaeria sporulosa]OAF98859.1 hypothetical protein CC84DRAFT_1200430 [Paraphaeosphaeria sporulosa]
MASTSKRMPDASPDVALSRAAKTAKVEPGLAQSPQAFPRPSPNDFSSHVKKRLAVSSRTGQACDRCKVRKIRCDPRPEGCSPCAQNRTPCKTTDRITGRATTRGQVEALESENSYLRSQVAELQAQLKELGVEPRATPSYSSTAQSTAASDWGDAPNRRASTNASTTASTSPPAGYTPASSTLETNRPLPQYKHQDFGDNYLGVSSADSLLSNISGTSLSVFGHDIDITDFVDDKDYDNSYMSYTYVMRVALSHTQPDPVPLPPYQTLKEYCTWWFRSMHPYMMLLDKTTLMKLVWRIGNEPGFKPSPSETVCVHMVIASLNYQISVRNRQEDMMEESHRHYRYALSFFKHLWLSHTWRDVQALTLIVHHLRNFPKPGAAWIMACTTFQLAMELGYHRSSKAWANNGHMDPLEVEVRKRTFWALHALTVNISGKLGRPMPIHMDDIDVEFPEPSNDCLPGEEVGQDDFHKCSFQVGIQVAKYTVPLSQLYRSLYSINADPGAYEETLQRLEAGIKQWKEDMPPQLRDPATASQEDYIFAVYLDYWYREYQLQMYHPAMCRSEDPTVQAASLAKCLVACQKLLRCSTEMRKLRSLDNIWINIVTYIAAIFTTLFGHHQKRETLTSADMDTLRSDMGEWIELISESGQLLGFGDKLKDAISQIIDRSLSSINASIVKRTASQSLAQVALHAPPEQTAAFTTHTNSNHRPPYSNAAGTAAAVAVAGSTQSQSYATGPANVGYTYSNGQAAPTLQQVAPHHGQQPYIPAQESPMAASHAVALQQAAATPRTDDAYVFGNSHLTTNGHSHQTSYTNDIPPVDWHQWTRAAIAYKHPGPQGEYLNSMRTHGSVSYEGGQGGQMSAVGEENVLQTLGSNNWPEMQFVPPNNAFGSQQYSGQQ